MKLKNRNGKIGNCSVKKLEIRIWKMVTRLSLQLCPEVFRILNAGENVGEIRKSIFKLTRKFPRKSNLL